MQITHFIQPENQEEGKVDLNNLKPVEEVQKQVVFEVEEKLDDKLEKFFNEAYSNDKDNVINKYRIVSKYFDMYSRIKNKGFEYRFLDFKITNYFRVGNNINEGVVDFLYHKKVFTDLNEFLDLNEESIFGVSNVENFIKNYKYIENVLGRDLNKDDFKSHNFIDFIKEGDTGNLEFLFKEIRKTFYMSDYHTFNDVFFEEKNISEKVGSKEIDGNLIVDFCEQKGLGEKLEYLYKKKGEFFNIHNYFDSQFVKKGNNYISKSVINFKKATDIITDKYTNIEISYYIINLLDNIGENIFLFEEFNISYDYFKNMEIGTENQNTKFIDFLLNSDTKMLKLLIKEIDGIKFKDLFSMYKTSEKLLSGYSECEVGEIKNINMNFSRGMCLELFKYAVIEGNFYFLGDNMKLLQRNYPGFDFNKNNNLDSITNKLIEVLSRTGGIITNGLFFRYILDENPEFTLDEYIKKFDNAMKKVLSSEEIKQEELDDFLYEAIYMAYRPTGFSEDQIKSMIENGNIEDLTHQLENIKFNEQGYDLVLNNNEIKLKGEIKEETLLYINEVFKPFKKDPFVDLNLKEFYSNSTEYIKILKKLNGFYNLNKDSRLEEFRININSDYISAYNNGNIAYDYLLDSYEKFGVVTKDSFPEYIKKELEKEGDEIIDDIFMKMSKLKDPRFKKEFEEVSENIILNKDNINLEERIEIITILTEKRIIEFGSFMRKKIKKELKKFKIVRGEEKQFKAIISKNIGSFFAKAGAELCTSNNTKMWEEERHVHLNLIDEERNQIVGNIMLYFEYQRGYLVVRGFNPIKEVVNNYDKKTIINEMIRVVKQIAKENGFDKVYIPKVNWKWHNLSNREGFQKLVWNESLKNINNKNYVIENAEFCETSIGENKVDELYLL